MFLWGLLGAALGTGSVLVLKALLRKTLEGRSRLGVALIALQPMGHFALLLVAALFSREALLWGAAGDCAALLIAGVLVYIMGRKVK